MLTSGNCILEQPINTKCIIGGASSIIDYLDLTLLNDSDVFVIGCNRWGLYYKCDIGIIQDALFFPETTLRLREKVGKLAIKDYELHPLVRKKADYLFTEDREISKIYNGKLYCGRTVALGALQLALQLGFDDILLVGVDCTSNYSKGYPGKDNEFKKAIPDIIKRIKELKEVFSANIWNANKSNMLEMPYKNYYEFLKNDQY